MTERPKTLIEDFMPVQKIGAESLREKSLGGNSFPPVNRLHVWWARRPLIVSRTAILASLLPAETERKWFLQVIGIHGDPATVRREIEEGHRLGKPIVNVRGWGNPYGYARAFTYNPSAQELAEIHRKAADTWDTDSIQVLDQFAGGGSIPFEALRFGFDVHATELNPVAAVILKATFEYPREFGASLASDIEHWGAQWAELAQADLLPYFPAQPNERVMDYMWARTVKCPDCGLVVPLSPNWRVDKTKDPPIAVRLRVPDDGDSCRFDLVEVQPHSEYDPGAGTVRNGKAQCPRCLNTISGDYIKSEAQHGRMGQQLYAMAVKTQRGREYRLPSQADLAPAADAERALSQLLGDWLGRQLPEGEVREGEKTKEPRGFGMVEWWRMFSPRQALVLGTYVKHLRTLKPKIRDSMPRERADAVISYLALAMDKSVDYDSRLTHWDASRLKICNTFDRHDFAFKWSFGEFEGARELLPWAAHQVVDAYKGICKLLGDDAVERGAVLVSSPECPGHAAAGRLSSRIHRGSAADLSYLADESIDLVCTDPPYYDNVMYGELSDFFYVWERLTLSDIYPEWFQDELTNKTDEAVANKSRFKKVGAETPSKQAKRDYEMKMQACFAEARRILKPDGVLTLMFTHKSVEAWDTLASALIRSGFEVTASWPVHTESDKSLNQAKKNAAQSTVLLVCRKRKSDSKGVWFDDIAGEIRQTARAKAMEFQEKGMRGVDLYISTFGPVLQILSRNWPVKDSSGELLRPDEALNVAREEVTDHRFRKILTGKATRFDRPTEFVILAWDIYQAAQIRYDEALKLARSVGIDIDGELKSRMALLGKSGNYVKMLTPVERRVKKPSQLDPNASAYESLINAIHVACLIYQEDGANALRRFFQRTNLDAEPDFLAAIEALLKSIPQKKATEGFFRPLYDLSVAFLEDKVALPRLLDDLEAANTDDEDDEDREEEPE